MEVHEDGTHPYTEAGSKVFYCYYIPKGELVGNFQFSFKKSPYQYLDYYINIVQFHKVCNVKFVNYSDISYIQ